MAQDWEYEVHFAKTYPNSNMLSYEDVQKQINGRARDGWELVTVAHGLLFFKRAMPPRPQ